MYKKKNTWKIIWIVGIYATLVLLLYLVVLYKVKWEDLDLNRYLYFYNCSGDVCTSENKVNNYYNYLKCQDNICPIVLGKKDSYVIIQDSDKKYIYDYKKDRVVSNEFTDYKFMDNSDYIIVINDKKLEGIIDYEGKTIFQTNYKGIVGYNNELGYMIYSENNKLGLANKSNSVNIKPKYDDIIFINATQYAYKNNGSYSIAKYINESVISKTTYDYIYPAKNILLTIKDNKLDIVDNNKYNSKLIMKIDTTYSYKTENEIKSLNIRNEDNYLLFTLYKGNETYQNYLYDINNNKLYS